MFEMSYDEIIPDAQIDIEVGTIEENGNMHLLPSDFNFFFDFSRKEGSQPSAHDGSQPSGDALALYGGGEPWQPADIELDEPDEHVDFSDVARDRPYMRRWRANRTAGQRLKDAARQRAYR